MFSKITLSHNLPLRDRLATIGLLPIIAGGIIFMASAAYQNTALTLIGLGTMLVGVISQALWSGTRYL
jgi:hypothetical protein